MEAGQDVLNPEALWSVVNGDIGLLRELVELFDQDSPRLLHNLRTALDHHESSEIRRAAHALKGSLMTFAAGPAISLAGELEERAKNGDLRDGEASYAALIEAMLRLKPVLHSMTCEEA